MKEKAKMNVFIGGIVILVMVSFAFGSFLGNKYDSKSASKEQSGYLKKMEELKANNSQKKDEDKGKDKDKDKDKESKDNVEDNAVSKDENKEDTKNKLTVIDESYNKESKSIDLVEDSEKSTKKTQENNESTESKKEEQVQGESSKDIYRIIVDGKQVIALTGYEKTLKYAKENYVGHIEIQRKDGSIAIEMDR